MITSTCLPSTAVMVSGEVRNGTCSMLTPATCLNISAARCWVAPKPAVPNVSLPGLALASATSSFTSFAGKSGRVDISRPAVATCAIGSNAVSVS